MIGFTVKTINADIISKEAANSSANIKKGIRNGNRKLGTILLNQFRSKSLPNGRGRPYRVGITRNRKQAGGNIEKTTVFRTRNASAAGDTPASRTRNLIRGLRFVIGTNNSEWTNAVNYARWLELGTRKIKPRPGMRLALDAKEREIQHIYGRAVAFILKATKG